MRRRFLGWFDYLLQQRMTNSLSKIADFPFVTHSRVDPSRRFRVDIHDEMLPIAVKTFHVEYLKISRRLTDSVALASRADGEDASKPMLYRLELHKL